MSTYMTHCTVCGKDATQDVASSRAEKTGKIHRFYVSSSYSHFKSDHDAKLKNKPEYDKFRNEYFCSEPQYKILQVMEGT